MSMSIDVYHERFVFVITPEVAATINMKEAGDTRSLNELSKEECVDYADITAAADVLNDLDGFRCPEFVGTAMHLLPDGEIDEAQEDDILFDGNGPFPFAGVACSKDPFFHPFSQTYANYGEVIEEFRNKLGDMLPGGFPIEQYVYAVSGTVAV